MFSKYILPLLALSGLGYAFYGVWFMQQTKPPAEPLQSPVSRSLVLTSSDDPANPKTASPDIRFQKNVIAGAGLVEAARENIPIGTHVPGVVTEVYVKVGQQIKPGDKLFKIDERAEQANLKVAKARREAAVAQLERLKASPRPEDIPVFKAMVEEAKARAEDAEAALARSKQLYERKMIPSSDYDRDRFTNLAAVATLRRSTKDLDKLLAGTWKPELKIAEAEVMNTDAVVEQASVALDRTTVTAYEEGEVLQVNIRPGQFASLTWKEPLILIGDLRSYHLRIDIDEHDLHRFQKNARASAFLKGRSADCFELEECVKVEPYVIPKRSLTGENTERVDTRVLQVIYKIKPRPDIPLYVGEQMDAFILTKPDAPSQSQPVPNDPAKSKSESESDPKTPAKNLTQR